MNPSRDDSKNMVWGLDFYNYINAASIIDGPQPSLRYSQVWWGHASFANMWRELGSLQLTQFPPSSRHGSRHGSRLILLGEMINQ